jgi:CRISPR/Cas system CMR subunit Cmr4 (Cas7 group RAMP superfamily)
VVEDAQRVAEVAALVRERQVLERLVVEHDVVVRRKVPACDIERGRARIDAVEEADTGREEPCPAS